MILNICSSFLPPTNNIILSWKKKKKNRKFYYFFWKSHISKDVWTWKVVKCIQSFFFKFQLKYANGKILKKLKRFWLYVLAYIVAYMQIWYSCWLEYNFDYTYIIHLNVVKYHFPYCVIISMHLSFSLRIKTNPFAFKSFSKFCFLRKTFMLL